MNALLKTFRILLSSIPAVSMVALICACAKQPTGIARNNPCDSGGSNWHPPVVNAGQDTSVSIHDTVRLHGSATDSAGRITSWAWDIGNTSTFITTSSGDTTIIAPAYESQDFRCVLQVTNDRGNVVKDTVTIIVHQDMPTVNLGDDTIAGLNDTMHLHGSATQQFGFIAKWEWKIGTGNWIQKDGPDTTIIMPDTGQTVICSLAVTDDDGNRSVDGIKIDVFCRIISVAASFTHSLILTADGTLWGCGFNWSGQLGDGTTTNRSTPIKIMTGVKSMAAGDAATLILKYDGSLWACGYNGNGQLCNGTTAPLYSPEQVMNGVIGITSEVAHSLMIMYDSTLWACGANFYGQLGTGDTARRSMPEQVLAGVKSAVVGSWHSLALKNDETLWGWGYNWCQQVINDPSMQNRWAPVQMMSGVMGMAAGSGHTLILKTDGTLWARGNNYYGQLCDGTYHDRVVTVQVMSDVLNVAAAYNHSMVLKVDSTVWVCGSGVLGDGFSGTRYSPVQVMSHVKTMATGEYHSLFVKNDGTLWGCGGNEYGQLGTGDTVTRLTPVRVIPPQ